MVGAKVLVVEDDDWVVKDLALKLSELGYDVVGGVSRGEHAVAAVERSHPDLILMDIMLSGKMDGITAAAEIQRHCDVPIIYLTAYASDALLSRARVTDPFGYILKPYSVRELHAVMAIALYKWRAERQLRTQAIMCEALTAISDPVLGVDREGTITVTNQALERFVPMTVAECRGKPWREVIASWDKTAQEVIATALEQALLGVGTRTLGETLMLKDERGEVAQLSLRVSPMRDQAATLLLVDITELKRNELALRYSEQRFRDVVEAAGEFVWESDEALRYTYLSHRFAGVLGYEPEEGLGRAISSFASARFSENLEESLANLMMKQATFRNLELPAQAKDGGQRWLSCSGVPRCGPDGALVGYRGACSDVTERKAAEAHIELLATRDHLTNLANRSFLYGRITQHLAQARRDGYQLAVLFIDLDRFKFINDSLGHDYGDEVLRQVAQRLSSCVRGRDTLSRIGGDEFVIVMDGVDDVLHLQPTLSKLLAEMRRPYVVNEAALNITATIGVSVFPGDGADGQSLLRNADAAMYHAKSEGRDRYQFYNKQMNDKARARLEMERDMRLALQCGEFVLYYQPKVDLRDGGVYGVEALIRWRHADKGLIMPSDFIPLAEEVGLIKDIGSWVIMEACRQVQAWRIKGYKPLRVAVNVSTMQIEPELATQVSNALGETGCEGRDLELEITESAMIAKSGRGVDVLQALRTEGVSVSMDDFGTGYSSLSNLHSFPLDTIKIDQSFIRGLGADAGSGAIVRAIIRMADSLELGVIAEGVEIESQLNRLRRLRCFQYQGFLFGSPMTAEALAGCYLSH